MSSARIGVVTVSDRASRGEYEDKGGPAILDWLSRVLICPWEAVIRVIPDERALIEKTLVEFSDAAGCCLIVTTGGTYLKADPAQCGVFRPAHAQRP